MVTNLLARWSSIRLGLVLSLVGLAWNDLPDPLVWGQPLLPVDTLPPTADLLRERPPLGFSKLPDQSANSPKSAERVELGRRLFFDPILSRDRQVSCASCHRPEHGMASPDPLAIGIQGRRGTRNAPSLFNRGFGESFFWDGRAATLEEQSLLPLSNPDEMGDDLSVILARLNAHPEYPAWFQAAFLETPAEGPKDLPSAVGKSDTTEPAVTAERLAQALAAFQRTLLLGDSPVDRFRAADVAGLDRDARQGLWIFESRGQCWQCHSGENFTDERFHNTGVGFGTAARDLGRFAVTHQAQDRFAFKTPTLRGLVQTAPYMHDGSHATLDEVIEFYNRGGAPDDPELSPLLKPLNLSPDEKRQLLAFLQALSAE